MTSALVGLVVGTSIWAAANSVPWWDPWGFWGFFFGVPAAIVTFGLVLMWLGRHQAWLGRLGRWLAITVLLLFGLLVCFGPYGAFSQPVFTLEWLWIFPLGVTPLVAAAWLTWAPQRKRRPGLWDAPPTVT